MAPVRDRLAERYPDVERSRPEILDDAAEFRVLLGDVLHGRASATAGVRSSAYRRQQLRGEHPLTDIDMAQLGQDAPDALAAALRPLVARLGYQMTPLALAQAELLSTVARVSRVASAAVEEGIEAARDGEVDVYEEARLERHAAELERVAAALRASGRRGKVDVRRPA